MIRYLRFAAALSLAFATSTHAAPYDDLPPEIREKILKNMQDMESVMKSASGGGPTSVTKDGGDYVLGSVPSPQDIDWVTAPEPNAKLVSYMAGKDGGIGAGVFGSPKTLSQLDNYYKSRLIHGWNRHTVGETQVLFLKGGPSILPVNVGELYMLLKSTPHVSISKLDAGSIMFDNSHKSSIEITSK